MSTMLAILFAMLATTSTPGEATNPNQTPYTGPVPIAWDRDAKPPNFRACIVGASDFTADAPAMQTALQGLNGYGPSHVQVFGAAPNTAPTWTNILNCIAYLKANTGPHDVAVLYIGTHGYRGCVPNLVSVWPWFAGDPKPDEAATEPAGDEVYGVLVDTTNNPPNPPQNPPFNCTAAGAAAGPRDGWFLTGLGGSAPPPAPQQQPTDWIRDDQLGAALAPGFVAGAGFIGIFDHCFSGEHADGTSDSHATLTAAGTPHTLLMSVQREHVCSGDFNVNIATGLQPVPSGLPNTAAACAGSFTRRADAIPNGGNGDCVTTGVELFNFAAAQPNLNPLDGPKKVAPVPPIGVWGPSACLSVTDVNPPTPNGAHNAPPVCANLGIWTSASKVVGGISLDPQLPGSSGSDAWLLEALAGGMAVVVITGGGVWYARRRRVR
jgi:hypothetical protein